MITKTQIREMYVRICEYIVTSYHISAYYVGNDSNGKNKRNGTCQTVPVTNRWKLSVITVSDVFLVCNHCCCSTVLLGIMKAHQSGVLLFITKQCLANVLQVIMSFNCLLVLVSLITTVIPQNAMSLFKTMSSITKQHMFEVTNVNTFCLLFYCSTVLKTKLN